MTSFRLDNYRDHSESVNASEILKYLARRQAGIQDDDEVKSFSCRSF